MNGSEKDNYNSIEKTSLFGKKREVKKSDLDIKKISPDAIFELANKDAKKVQEQGVAVFKISGKNDIEERYNSAPKLNVIGVVGEGAFRGVSSKEALLCEIGIGHSEPYQRAGAPRKLVKENEPRTIARRRKWFSMDINQYTLVAPRIFDLLQEISNKKVNSRKYNLDNPFYIKISKKFWSPRRGWLKSEKSVPVDQGIVFLVDVRDSLLVKDILWAELNNNIKLNSYLDKFARLISKRLSKCYSRRKSFEVLKGVKEVTAMVDRVPLYLRQELLNRISNNKKVDFSLLANIRHYIFKWDGKESLERLLALDALPNPKNRIGDMQLRIISGLENLDKKTGCLKFKVMALEESAQKKEDS